jgi:hypothetical protein
MAVDQTNAVHPGEVAVEGPNLCVVVSGDGGNQKIGEAETLTCRPRDIKPVFNTRPSLTAWKENRKCREDPTEVIIVTIGSPAQNFDTNGSSEADFAGVEER